MDGSPELMPLLTAVRAEIDRQPVNPVALREDLESLLSFLASPEGRTDANCRATDAFFAGPEAAWDYSHLPPEFASVLDDMSMQLHDTVSEPHIASMFESTPEQLLERVRAIRV